MSSARPLARWAVAALTALIALQAAPAVAKQQSPQTAPEPRTAALARPFTLARDRDVNDRFRQPEDRYALAGGCYTIEAVGQGHVARSDDGITLAADRADAEPFHFQATRLGEYLIATNEGPDTSHPDAWWDLRGYLSAAPLLPVSIPPGVPLPGRDVLPGATLPAAPTGSAVTVAEEPGPAGEWRVAAVGDDPDRRAQPAPQGQPYRITLPASGQALSAAESGLTLAGDEPGEFRFHRVEDDDPTDDDPNGTACADWPEMETNTSGRPAAPEAGPADQVQGFFEAHIHGMAFEFLGGEFRCGRPWHPYGVEYALGSCMNEGNQFNSVLEAVVGDGPERVPEYDPVGWPTFDYWPRPRTLTHEQFYWRWLERAYHGGLRLLTNLLVDNTALCQAYPIKRNSCNEMDGVRLQAQRLFELQNYIDAQSGGPGEGWLRIVTSPAQARAVINEGRLAVVLGIEVSVLFDCGEILDVALCTIDDIDARLQEVFDMGIRQMELLNKFDNALSGVTGDGGATGIVVNTGNRHVTGHYWDMGTCGDGHDHEHGLDGNEHDKTQLNAQDDLPDGGVGEIDVLAGAVLEQFGATRGFVAPAYPAGPHCNTRGLTPLGEHLVREMIKKGMIFDPDHMSALAQRQALDLIENTIIPEEHEQAAAEGRAPVQPAVVSSHSWANDVVYQWIYRLDGHVAPRTGDANGFVGRWRRHKTWAQAQAPDGSLFGLGYGADTNGLGGQPERRSRNENEPPVDYTDGFAAPIGEVTVYQHRSGVRPFDIDSDGVVHYGLFADWFHELSLAADARAADIGGGTAIIEDMLDASESYIRMWERAVYGANDCVSDQSAPQVEDLHALIGGNVEGFLQSVGQPVDRDGAAYIYCVEGSDGRQEVVQVLFDAAGTAVDVVPVAAPAAGAGATASALQVTQPALGAAHQHSADLRSHQHSAPDSGRADTSVLVLAMAALALALHRRRRRT